MKIRITVHSQPDSLGRQRFTIDWTDYRGKRGQCFNAQLQPYLDRCRERGDEVEVCEEHDSSGRRASWYAVVAVLLLLTAVLLLLTGCGDLAAPEGLVYWTFTCELTCDGISRVVHGAACDVPDESAAEAGEADCLQGLLDAGCETARCTCEAVPTDIGCGDLVWCESAEMEAYLDSRRM